MIVILHEQTETACPRAHVADENLWIESAQLSHITGWALKPEGFCRDEVCVPVPPARASEFVRDGAVNVSGFWAHIGNAVAHDESRTVWALGASASERGAALRSLEAPDFSLPDLGGTMHALHEQRGKKVLLVTWASW